MSVIVCSKCGWKFSSQYTACPKCGSPYVQLDTLPKSSDDVQRNEQNHINSKEYGIPSEKTDESNPVLPQKANTNIGVFWISVSIF